MNAHGHLRTCPRCHKSVDVKSPYVSVEGSAIQVYCSDDCLRGVSVLDDEELELALVKPEGRWRRWWLAAGAMLGATIIYAVDRYDVDEHDARRNALAILAMIPRPAPPAPPPEATAPPGPSPEEKARQEADDALFKELVQDAWIHPLAGPTRRMPANHTGAFGWSRANAPPPECLQGHCGVDVGHEWGEPIHAVHDGVIDWVNRGPNDEHGGVFVKIAHREGSLYSWYFHLAAVPRWVKPGLPVKVGTVIGLLGDTGIKHSQPHLHFALTVKASERARERYIDPEPLLALWPLWLPDDKKISSKVAAPGVPVRIRPGTQRKQRPGAPRSKAASAETDRSSEPGTMRSDMDTGAPDPSQPPAVVPMSSGSSEPGSATRVSH